jgi:DNA-binding transcriptional ArsR family regulator
MKRRCSFANLKLVSHKNFLAEILNSVVGQTRPCARPLKTKSVQNPDRAFFPSKYYNNRICLMAAGNWTIVLWYISNFMSIDLVEFGSALSCPTRVLMLADVHLGDRSVGVLANIARVGIATASYHVARLAQVGLVEVRLYRNRRIVCLTAKVVRLHLGV